MYEAHALGTLDAEERAALEAHLATGCQDCAKAIEEARWLVSQLAYLAPQAAPSDMLKGRLMQTVRAEAQAAKRAPQAKSGIPQWMWTGVAALLLLSLYSTFQMHVAEQRRRTSVQMWADALEREHKLMEELRDARLQAFIVTDPASVKIALTPSDPHLAAIEAKWHNQFGIVLTGQNVPVPDGNRVLQLWLIPKAPGAEPMPSLTIRPYGNGELILLVSNPPEVMANTKALAITEEPAGGSPQPTTTPRWVGGVT